MLERAGFSKQQNHRAARSILILFLIAAGLAAHLTLLRAAGNSQESSLSGGSDAPAYILLANQISQGKGMTYAGQPTALRAPLYPLILGVMDLVFDSNSLLIMRIIQFVIAILTAWVCAQTAMELWGKDAKWASFGLAIFMPTLLFFTPQILTETFTAFLVSLFLYFLVRADQENSSTSLVGMGVSAGLLMLLRFNALFVPLVAAAALLRMPINLGTIRRALLPVAIAAVLVSPWIVRNIVVFQGGLLYSSQTGVILLQGAVFPQGRSRPGESELWKRAGWWGLHDIEIDSLERLRFPSEVVLDRQARHEALGAWEALGLRAFPLLAKKIGYFWFSTDQLWGTVSLPRGQRILRASGVLFYWAILGMAIVSWFRLRKGASRIAYVFLFYCLAVTMLHLPCTMNTRLRIPYVDPLLCILAVGQYAAAFSRDSTQS